jgi:hypothetical protein
MGTPESAFFQPLSAPKTPNHRFAGQAKSGTDDARLQRLQIPAEKADQTFARKDLTMSFRHRRLEKGGMLWFFVVEVVTPTF